MTVGRGKKPLNIIQCSTRTICSLHLDHKCAMITDCTIQYAILVITDNPFAVSVVVSNACLLLMTRSVNCNLNYLTILLVFLFKSHTHVEHWTDQQLTSTYHSEPILCCFRSNPDLALFLVSRNHLAVYIIPDAPLVSFILAPSRGWPLNWKIVNHLILL